MFTIKNRVIITVESKITLNYIMRINPVDSRKYKWAQILMLAGHNMNEKGIHHYIGIYSTIDEAKKAQYNYDFSTFYTDK